MNINDSSRSRGAKGSGLRWLSAHVWKLLPAGLIALPLGWGLLGMPQASLLVAGALAGALGMRNHLVAARSEATAFLLWLLVMSLISMPLLAALVACGDLWTCSVGSGFQVLGAYVTVIAVATLILRGRHDPPPDH
jgi:hypothetical protein